MFWIFKLLNLKARPWPFTLCELAASSQTFTLLGRGYLATVQASANAGRIVCVAQLRDKDQINESLIYLFIDLLIKIIC